MFVIAWDAWTPSNRTALQLILKIIILTFIRVMVTLLMALAQSVSCYENVICFQKVS